MAEAAPIINLGQDGYTETISEAICRAAEASGEGAKYIARVANSNIRTVESWMQRRSTPSGLHLLRLIAQDGIVQAEIRRLTAMESELDPELERDLHRLFSTLSRTKTGVTS